MDIENEDLVIVPPDGGWGWVVVFASFLCTFFGDGIVLSFGIFMQTLSDDLHETIGKIAIITSVNQIFYFFTGPIVSALVNKIGNRAVGFLGGLICVVGYGASAWAHNLSTMLVTIGILTGIGLGMLYAPANIIIGLYFEKWRAMAQGIAACGSSVGVLVMVQVINILLDKFGWRNSYLILGGIMVSTSLAALTYLPIKPVQLGPDGKPMRSFSCKSTMKELFCPCCERRKSPEKEPKTEEKGNKKSCKECTQALLNVISKSLGIYLLKSPAFILFLFSGTFLLGGYIVPYIYIENRAVKNGIDKNSAVWMISTIGIANTAGRIVGGVLSSVSNINLVLYSLIWIAIGGIAAIVSSLKVFMVNYFQLIYVFIHGFSISCFCLRPVIVIQLFGLEHLTQAFGLMMLFFGIGCFATTSLGGMIYDYTGKYDGVFYLGGSCMVASSICLAILPCTRKWEKKRGILV